MAQQSINLGSSANDGTGTTLRAGGDMINDNFTELYARGYRGDWDPTGDVLPSSSVVAGQTWRLTADYKGWRGLIQAAVNSPASDADWNFINLTTF